MSFYLTRVPGRANLINDMASQKKKTAKEWNILLVEDDLTTRAQLLKSLSQISTCTTVETGEKAIEIYRKYSKKNKHFDFILLDITIPGIDGFEVLKTIRAEEESLKNNSKIPSHIIMVTAYKDSLMENYNMGWDDFITKPINSEKLIDRMHSIMEKK